MKPASKPVGGGGHDIDDIELLDDLLSAASLDLEAPEKLQRHSSGPKSAGSGFSAWTNEYLQNDNLKTTKKD